MQITNPEQLQILSRNDIVHATFSDINGDVVDSNGRIDEVNEVFDYFTTLIIIYLVLNMVFEIILFFS